MCKKVKVCNDERLFSRVVAIIEHARARMVRSINNNTVVAYWLIGREIVRVLQDGVPRAGYGEKVIEDLSIRLTARYGSGFSVTNLKYFRAFYQAYIGRISEKSHPLAGQSISQKKSHPAGGELIMNFHPNLSWSHYRALMTVEKSIARDFYEKEAVECGWSKRELERQINSLFYERLLVSKDKRGMLRVCRKAKNNTVTPMELIKDPYVLEFLDLPNVSKLRESHIESAIIDNIQKFLLEFGKGFSFVARQKLMRFDNKDFYIDMVFYNYLLKCFVLIDLKVGELTHQDIGQMDSYVRMYEENCKVQGDNPTIGLILCSRKNETIARYSVLKENKRLFASQYRLYLPTEEELRREIERERLSIESKEEKMRLARHIQSPKRRRRR